MSSLNEIYGRHGFDFWIVSVVLDLLSYSVSIGNFVKAIPQGIRQAIRYQREARLQRLQAYAEDKTRIFRYILGQVCVNVLIMSSWLVYSSDHLFFHESQNGSISDLIVRLLSEAGAVYVLLTGFMQLLILNSALVLLALWTFRDPEVQMKKLRDRLDSDDSQSSREDRQ